MASAHGREQELDSLFSAVEAGRSVLLSGPLGSGKTHVIKQLLATRREQWHVAHVVASEAASTIPFGAVAALLPSEGAADAYALLRGAAERFTRLAIGSKPLVVVDDVHHLDAASTALVHNLCVVQGATLIAAARTGVQPPPAVVDLVKELGAERLELGRLADDYLRALAALELECAVDDPVVDEMLARSGRNPLFLGELVRAYRSGAPGGLSSQLIDLVRARLAGLSTDAHSLMEYVAVGEPMLTSLDVVDDVALAELERSGLVVTSLEDDVTVARSAHPLYGEVVRAELSPTSRQLVAKRLAASMLSLQRRRGDALRLAGWLLDIGLTPDPLLACEAAREAASWLQTDLADRLIRIALDVEQSYEVLMVAGSLRRIAGDVRAAESWYLAALDVAPGDGEMFEAALTLAQLYAFYDGNPAAASAVLSDVASRVSDDLQRRQLEVERSVFAALGQYDEVLDVATKLLHDPARDERAEWVSLTTALWAEVQLMRLGDVDQHLARIAQLLPAAIHDRAGTVDMIWALELTVRLERGELRAGIARGEVLAQDALRLGVPGGLIQFAIGHLRWLAGDLTGARQAAQRAIDKLRQFDSFNAVPMVKASAAILAIIDGDREAALGGLLLADRRSTGVNPVSPVWLRRANGWLVAEDDPDEAVRCFLDASRVGREGSTFAWALLALHDAVLFDAARLAMDEIEAMRLLPVEAPFMELLVEHAAARAADDVERIRACATRFESAGARWYAANAWGAVARAEDSEVAQARAATRAALLAPPAALTVHAHEVAELALRPRQLQVAMLAATGMPSRAIAESVYVSSRTVDNHLRIVYRRLGVDGRSELGGILGLNGVHP